MESSYEQKKLALIEEINIAFDGVSRENGVSLSEAWVIDNYGSDEERAEARKQDTETRWQDVPDEAIAHSYSCLGFLDEIGFRYYAPAYIVWFLRYIDIEDSDNPNYYSMSFDTLLYALERIVESHGSYRIYKFKLFTTKQAKAVANFLKFDEERQDEYNAKYDLDLDNHARVALEKYWGQFL